jgi:Holliday junction resolvasome RuvABC endonuclease subunit
MKHVMGFDPGFASFGVAVVELGPDMEKPIFMGVIRTKKSTKRQKMLATEDNFDRVQIIVEELSKLVLQYDLVALSAESMSFPRNASSSAKVGMTWGVIAALSIQHQFPVFQCTPQQLKIKLTGSRKASKTEVADALRLRYPNTDFEDLLKFLPMGEHEHAWDALASVVVCLDAEPVKMVRRLA